MAHQQRQCQSCISTVQPCYRRVPNGKPRLWLILQCVSRNSFPKRRRQATSSWLWNYHHWSQLLLPSPLPLSKRNQKRHTGTRKEHPKRRRNLRRSRHQYHSRTCHIPRRLATKTPRQGDGVATIKPMMMRPMTVVVVVVVVVLGSVKVHTTTTTRFAINQQHLGTIRHDEEDDDDSIPRILYATATAMSRRWWWPGKTECGEGTTTSLRNRSSLRCNRSGSKFIIRVHHFHHQKSSTADLEATTAPSASRKARQCWSRLHLFGVLTANSLRL